VTRRHYPLGTGGRGLLRRKAGSLRCLLVPAPAFLRNPRLLAGIFGLSGIVHLVKPGVYEDIVPDWVPRHREVVYASGVVELVCAAGLARDAAWAGWLSAATLLGVWPANIQMALDATRAGRPVAVQAGLWGRVPFQLPMVRLALRAGSKP
jgi:uncharacterized membrane protein